MIVLKELNKLPVSLAHGATGRTSLVAIVRVVPIERVPFKRFLLAKQASDIDAVTRPGRAARMGQVRNCGQEIRPYDRNIADASRSCYTGPVNNQGFSYAAFVEVSLACMKTAVVGDAVQLRP